MSRWTLTVREGPRVARRRFADLDTAVASLRDDAQAIAASGRLGPVEGFREYEPGERVRARLQLSTGWLLRGREAGVDVMGDGRLIPYGGAVRRQPLEPMDGETEFDAVRRVLS